LALRLENMSGWFLPIQTLIVHIRVGRSYLVAELQGDKLPAA
jgi:hypothetical protein